MNLQRYITFTMFFVFCLPLMVAGAPAGDADLTYGFLGDPLPAEVMLYEGRIDHIPEEGGVISLNDTLYKLMTSTLYLTAFKTKTSLEYFHPATSVKFYAQVHDRVIYEIMAVSSPEQTEKTRGQRSEKSGTLIFKDGVWQN